MTKLNELIGQQKDLNYQIKLEKRKQHLEFCSNHKNILRFFDIIAIIVILFNFGAICITDYLVEKEAWQVAKAENKTLVYMEANPIASENHGYKAPETAEQKLVAYSMLFAILKQGLLWCLMAFLYMVIRINVRSTKDLYWLMFIVLFYFIILGMDFFHDLGLFISKVLHG